MCASPHLGVKNVTSGVAGQISGLFTDADALGVLAIRANFNASLFWSPAVCCTYELSRFTLFGMGLLFIYGHIVLGRHVEFQAEVVCFELLSENNKNQVYSRAEGCLKSSHRTFASVVAQRNGFPRSRT